MKFKIRTIYFIIILALFVFSSNSFASSLAIHLDLDASTTREEILRLIKRKNLELEVSLKSDDIYAELAADARQTAFFTRALAPSGIALVAWPLAGIAASYGSGGISAAICGTGALFGSAGAFLAAEAISFFTYFNVSISDGDLALLIDQARSSKSITFTQLQNDLEFSRQLVMEKYFDGSLKNQIKDSLRLGGLSKEGTHLLWLIQSAKTKILKDEIDALNTLLKIN